MRKATRQRGKCDCGALLKRYCEMDGLKATEKAVKCPKCGWLKRVVCMDVESFEPTTSPRRIDAVRIRDSR